MSAWASRNAPKRDVVPEWSGRLAGAIAHQAIALAVLEHHPGAPVDGVRWARPVIPEGLAPTHRLMLERRAAAAAATYLFEFDPRPSWEPLGVEVTIADVRLDLLFRRGAKVRADEIKTGRLNRGAYVQAEIQAQRGREAFGASFAGVRLISLAASESRLIRPRIGGSRRP